MFDFRISIRLGPTLGRKVRQEAKARHLTISALVREVLEDYLAECKSKAGNRPGRSRKSS